MRRIMKCPLAILQTYFESEFREQSMDKYVDELFFSMLTAEIQFSQSQVNSLLFVKKRLIEWGHLQLIENDAFINPDAPAIDALNLDELGKFHKNIEPKQRLQLSRELILNVIMQAGAAYLVFLLQRFAQTPQLLESVLATDFLEAMHTVGKQQIESLRAVGDKSLLLCGLFPGMATRRHVTLEYYTGMGRSAYLTISELHDKPLSELYFQLSEGFLNMQKILQAIRGEYYQFEAMHAQSVKLNDDSHMH